MDYKFINTEYLNSVAGGDSEIIREIVILFKEQVSEIYTEMIALHSAGDYPALGLLAHKAKSSVAIMGMESLASMLKTLELNAKEGKDAHMFLSFINRFREETKKEIR